MTTAAQALAAHLQAVEGNAQPRTVRQSRLSVRAFLRHAGLSDSSLVSGITREQVEAFLEDGRNRGWASTTERRHYYEMERFFDLCFECGWLLTSPMERMDPPAWNGRKVSRPAYSQEDIGAIFAACDRAGYRWLKLRNRMVVWLMWAGGCWPRDILSLRIGDVDLSLGTLRLSKRTAALPTEATDVIQQYLKDRRSRSPILVLSRSRQQLTPQGLGKIMSELGQAVGMPVNSSAMRAAWKAQGGSFRRPRRSRHAIIRRPWGNGPMAQARDAFLSSVQAQDVSQGTLDAYSVAIARFLAFVLPERPDVTPQEITPGDAEAFLISLHGRLSGYTVHQVYRGLRRWFGFLYDRDEISNNPMLKVKAPRLPKITIEPYSLEEVERMLAVAAQDPRFAKRDITIITTLYGTGVRKAEMVNLMPSDIKPGQLLVRQGKGKKDRWVPLDPHTEQVLTDYTADRSESQRVFAPLGGHGVYIRLCKLAKQAGTKNVGVHRFRDSFAVRFLENGGAVDDLQVILGHSDISTTLRYVRWGREQRAVDKGRQFTPWAKNGETSPQPSVPSTNGTDELALLDELERIARRKLELLRGQGVANVAQ